MTYVIGPPCIDVKDASCVAECPVDCIYIGGRMLYINPEECIDCGACEPVCPVEAIYPAEYLPVAFKAFSGANAEFFERTGLGSPGGASGVEALEEDHPLIADWPRNNVGSGTNPYASSRNISED